MACIRRIIDKEKRQQDSSLIFFLGKQIRGRGGKESTKRGVVLCMCDKLRNAGVLLRSFISLSVLQF